MAFQGFETFSASGNLEQTFDLNHKEQALGFCAALLGSLVIAGLSIGRSFFTFGTESDYIGRDMLEAARVLEGKSLDLSFHPPLYPIVVGLVEFFIRDWFRTGLIISWASSIVVLGTSFVFFHRLAGRYAAWGSLAGLMSSSLFVSYSSFATSDVFFLALYSSCFLISLLAAEKGSKELWVFTGASMGLGLLSRSNGLTLLLVLGLPLALGRSFRIRLENFALVLLGGLVVLGGWGIFATLTGAPLIPQFGHLNLATHYFFHGGDPVSAEARREMAHKFRDLWGVLAYDPEYLIVTYVKEFPQMLKNNFGSHTLLAFPLYLLALPGVLLLFFKSDRPFAVFFLTATVSQVALLNLKEYEPRYYLFLVPIMSAGAGLCAQHIWAAIPKAWMRSAAIVLFLPFIVSGVKDSFERTYRSLHTQDAELAEAVPKAKSVIDSKGLLVSHKANIAFYVGVRNGGFPEVQDLQDLRLWLEGLREKEPTYVYFGPAEARARPQVGALRFPKEAPDWLEPLVQSEFQGSWVLYRFKK